MAPPYFPWMLGEGWILDSKKDKRNEKSPGFNVGSASIIMVFAVLCLTIFSVLSVMTANSDLKLSNRAKKSIEDYYNAEYVAETKVLEIRDKLKEDGSPYGLLSSIDGIKIEKQGNADAIHFIQKVDEKRDIHVTLICSADKKLAISEWKLLPNDEWNPDAGVEVWLGN